MIKINLLPQRKPKRQTDPALRPLAIGISGLAIAAVAVLLLVDRPRRSKLDDLQQQNNDLNAEIRSKNDQLKGFTELLASEKEAEARAGAITRLGQAKVVPAHVLNELSRILTERTQPTMTAKMTAIVAKDPNKKLQTDWDPTHVWVTSFKDSGGTFHLEGGAQAEADVNQLWKRLAASVYFTDVSSPGGQHVADAATGQDYYKFQISGKVAY